MRALLLSILTLSFLTLSGSASMWARPPLEVFFIDVEGGQSTLLVTGAGQSLLIDTGWPGNAYRDANRIVKAAKLAGIKKIDYLLITHYHVDHVGGVPQLAAKLPIGTFIDHGPNEEDGNSTRVGYADYQKAMGSANHLVVKPGDHLPIKGMDAVVVSADGNLIGTPVPGAGQPNSACAGVAPKELDKTENARSVGLLITVDKFKIVDLGDLTWNKELDLMCPNNKLGTVDVSVVSHHGMDMSNSAALVHAISPKVAIMDNGAKKGGAPVAWDTVKSTPGLEDLWQLHFANAGGQEHNSADPFVANVQEGQGDTGNYLKLTLQNGAETYTVLNPRNKYSKTYDVKSK